MSKHPVYLIHIPKVDNLKLVNLLAKFSKVKLAILSTCVEPTELIALHNALGSTYTSDQLNKAVLALLNSGWLVDLWYHVDGQAFTPTYDDAKRNNLVITFARQSKFKSRS